jgi:hypothetical protein
MNKYKELPLCLRWFRLAAARIIRSGSLPGLPPPKPWQIIIMDNPRMDVRGRFIQA